MKHDPWTLIPYVGSFQGGRAFPSEDPRAEVWLRLGRYGTPELSSVLVEQYGPRAHELSTYVQARLKQAIEFREAARGRSVLVSPLMMYYSFLNISRALVALVTGKTATARHGLTCGQKSVDLFDTRASVCNGTFPDYLAACGGDAHAVKSLSLREALNSIPELFLDQSNSTGFSRVQRARVHVLMNQPGWVEFCFELSGTTTEEFREQWPLMFPSLKEHCVLAPEGAGLRLKQPGPLREEQIRNICYELFWDELVLRDNAFWYLLREDEMPKIERSAYYLLAMFILSSVVRYDPDEISALVGSGSDAAWLLERFIDKSDRFFPQLAYSIVVKRRIYF